MHTNKKIIFYAVIATVCFSSLSGCILEDLILGTSFSLNSWEVGDDEGFPCISFNFSSSGTVTAKLFGPDENLRDSDLIFYGGNTSILYLAAYKESVAAGKYILKVYDKDDSKIFEKPFSFDGTELFLTSCDQKWWKGKSLIGLVFTIHNSGDTPAYPHTVEASIDSKTYTGPVLPNVILPGKSNIIDCFVYKENIPTDSEFAVSLKDSLGVTIGTGSFSIDMSENVPTKDFKWRYKWKNQQLSIPHPGFLYEHYSSVKRSYNEDYSLYVFDSYDNDYITLIANLLLDKIDGKNDIDIINFAASFIQNLNYKKDSDTNESFEYPRYPIETIDNDGGDCEDLAILAASILSEMEYNVALFRFSDHMAVGVSLNDDILGYEHYIDNYYFLETTTKNRKLGFIPTEYRDGENLTVYPISSRPLFTHEWKNGTITILKETYLGDLAKVTLFVENLGSATAEDFFVTAGFYTQDDLEINVETETISSLKPGMKKKITLLIDIPQNTETWFKTKVYMEGEIVDEKDSASSFP